MSDQYVSDGAVNMSVCIDREGDPDYERYSYDRLRSSQMKQCT